MEEGYNRSMSVADAKPLEGHPEAATSSVLAEFQPILHRFLTRRLRRERDAEDLIQEAYLQFLQFPRHQLVRAPHVYLYRIAANLLYQRNLREKRQPVIYDSEMADDAVEQRPELWDEGLDDRMNSAQQVQRVLGQLPKLYRLVLVMRTRDGMSREEIARELGISPQTVKKYTFRAIAHFRAAQWDW
jgi:RNA polymerase sigma factor (sigma-70 family)